MFLHFEKPSKCEWLEGGLDQFVSHYNRECGTAHSHTDCLDVVKVGGATPKAPEVLVTDSTTGNKMVLERKSVFWPPQYALRHKNEHAFANAVWHAVGSRFSDGYYELTVSSKQLEMLDTAAQRKIAREIGLILTQLSPSDLRKAGNKPIWWSFCVDEMAIYENRKGVVVQHLDDPLPLEHFDKDEAKAGTAAEMQKQLETASKKFSRYSNARKVVLLDFFGDKLHEEDIPPLLAMIKVPVVIDEVWRTVKDWTSHDDYQIGYERIFVRPE
jgi:hypothetical protein